MGLENHINEENAQRIDERIEAGLALLRERYAVEERAVDSVLADVVVDGRPHHARQYHPAVPGHGAHLDSTTPSASRTGIPGPRTA